MREAENQAARNSTPIRVSERQITWHGERSCTAFGLARLHARPANEGCPLPAAMHDAPTDPPTLKNKTLTGDFSNEARPLRRARPRETRHHR